MFGLRKWRRRRLRSRPFPSDWIDIIEENVPYYKLLPELDRKELHEHIAILLAEKNFEGCGGLELTDEIRVTIAAHACILLLHRKTDYFPGLYSILVYPGAFIAKGRIELWPGFYSEVDQVHLGESWKHGALVLSWDHVLSDSHDTHGGHNVVLHEFAHQLDQEDGRTDGAPILPHRSLYSAWARVLGRDYARLQNDVTEGRPSLLDPYGATAPAEFFAVTTECFFETPVELKKQHPELYHALQLYYLQDPAELVLKKHSSEMTGEA